MNIFLFAIVLMFWIIVAILDYSEFCYFIQLKEYRFDRFGDFLSTQNGKKFLKSYAIIGRLAIFILVLTLFLLGIKFPIYIFFFLLGIEFFRYVFKFFKGYIRRPEITIKAIFLIFAVIAVEIAIWILFENAAIMLMLFGIRFFIISLAALVFYLPNKLLKTIYIKLAAQKLKTYKNLKVVGITGSYGKTTVKNFLAQILEDDFKILSTPKNINTEIGIAKLILKNNFLKVNVFIVEMGAYRKNEIKLICNIVRPEIGILTAINEQHLSLFGSINNIQQAKYELLNSLPKNGLAIVNSDNFYCREFISNLSCETKTFGMLDERTPDYFIKNLKEKNNESIIFIGTLKNNSTEIHAPVLGVHNAMNIAPCILAANHLGMKMEKIIEKISHLNLPAKTLNTYSYGENAIIDDSYNSNPAGFSAALRVLGDYPGQKKIVITRGMLELGKKSPELHKKIGRHIGKIADELVIISEDSEEYLKEGAKEIKVTSLCSPQKLLQYIKNMRDEKNVILLENRIPGNVMQELTGK